MSNVYDHWERLVGAVIRREELWRMFHDQSPSVSSIPSDCSLDSQVLDVPFDFSSPRSSSSYQQLPPSAVENLQKKEKSAEKEVSKLKLVIKVEVHDEKEKRKAMKAVSRLGGIESLAIDMKEKKLTVVGGFDPVQVVSKLSKSWYTEILTVGPAKEPEKKKEEGKKDDANKGKNGKNRAPLDWETRLRIALGAAKGIAHIHKQSSGKLVHGNIKSSNIFLNSQQYGCVSDLGLASMIQLPVMRTAGHHAPEVKNTRNVSQASDVYSFGILVLELLTRKSPLHAIGDNEVLDLVKLVNSLNGKERTADVFDVEISRNRNKEQRVKMLEIAMSCVAKNPSKRPKMDQVVKMMEVIWKMMEDITKSYERNQLQPKLVFNEGRNLDFGLEDLLRASAEVLGKGTFGTSYEATLDNGITIVVKTLKDVIVTSKEFQQQMEVIGRMKNESVATLMAYYYSRDYKLVVYDYYGAGSVSSMLHGQFGKGKISLDWETRLRIAVGAARGIAHIHSQVGQNLVHGNVKTSKYFLTAQGYGCVSDVGLATLVSTTSVLHSRSSGYRAPEVVDTKKLSQASDVYSFGVVLLELHTGKPTILYEDNEKASQLVRWVASVVREDWTAEVFDIELLRYQNIEKAMVEVLQIALYCVESVPKHRPKMSEVVSMLEDISRRNSAA
ncbi:probable LRR receptor-like serine/threonine-protein kinase At1g51880 [Olea europaea var. sylvestris]|uniref:probable LRR receptor-like serine/threonine-protein kinase At1g51880 n=1 Tax=Olea europaea var. sylvestris TaxID=158386 RepID=UPI000C1CF4D4|nr:probable LRR receptor-like serine/threonine-protein kinase At1g51880 [Olea europaea var. sylvestris]